MITIAQTTKYILLSDPIAFEAARLGLLNLSAYADQIKDRVEEKTFKKVKKTTIVVALSRMLNEIKDTSSLVQDIKLDDIIIKTPICDISYQKNIANITKAQSFAKKVNDKDFFTITQSNSEITIIAPSAMKNKIIRHFDTEPKMVFDNTVCITARFSEEYLNVANFIYTIIRAISVRRINIIEIVSTFTEISVIVDQDDMQETLDALKVYF